MLWDIFCRVIDNYGDLGVCWRLSANLAGRGEQVRLWVDDPQALAWMAPHGCAGVTVHRWQQPLALQSLESSDVLVEAFGCNPPGEYLAWRAHKGQQPVWINFEYLSAEPYAERCHGLTSPIVTGPASGWQKWFFYPGFTTRTGGLLREADLLARQAEWDSHAWRQRMWPLLTHHVAGERGVKDQPPHPAPSSERWISLFCYEPAALAGLLAHLAGGSQKTRLLVTPGRAAMAVRALLSAAPNICSAALSISFLPVLTQVEFDELLWGCALNFVRGEDSLVRALWAGQPFVWHIYPQQDGAHFAKLEALLDEVGAPPSLRLFHHIWNARLSYDECQLNVDSALAAWAACTRHTRERLLVQPDLTTQLLQFVQEKR